MIDLLIVALYLISLLIVGIYTRSRKAGFKGFTLVKDEDYKHGKLILVATIFASSIGGGTTFGISEMFFRFGWFKRVHANLSATNPRWYQTKKWEVGVRWGQPGRL